jgi:hypothetical protein
MPISREPIGARRKRFRECTEVRVLAVAIACVLVGGLIALLGLWLPFEPYIGVGLACLGVIVAVSFRNYSYAQQVTYQEFRERSTYAALVKWLIIILVFYVIALLLFPVEWLRALGLGRFSIMQVAISSFVGIVIVMVNLYLPWWIKQRDFREKEIDQVKELYSRLDLWFKELDLARERTIPSVEEFEPDSYKYKEHVAKLRRDVSGIQDVVEFIALGLYLSIVKGETLPGQRIKLGLSLLGSVISIGFSFIKFSLINITTSSP